jgi:RNA polymerase sigma-70 factor (ECF subfamily)
MGGIVKELTDPELVASLAAGEVEALRTLYQRYGALCYSLAVRILGDPGRAEDVVQDAFIRLWTHANSYDSARARSEPGC